RRARRGIARQARIERGRDGLEIERILANERRAIDLLDRRHHAVSRIGDEVARADGTHLAQPGHAARVALHEHRFPELLLRRSGVVAAAREDALHAHGQLGYVDLDALDLHVCTPMYRW